ncbi:MAG: ImmA/IrrE family metallo-endopeptidase [Acidobacteria bacterium]|nr:ImmA/IrrE family metallo-endopeptidase [Acidobacteriota bacterium]MBK9529237.1 ImmA/IrrE family metallo-endopeptidase [Acidobacteriota bacterium]MBP7474201.1 ImmA/IrrE family metallo-endopeptidase [Pyrinomonadaceae bacterium]MBP9109651.1 ImmA/IrrE family metallo-endopeptidase [Pyrinomonadaceae bacterium]
MQFLSDKVARLNIGWNERPLTEVDFYRICKRFKITVEEMPLRVSGFYYRVLGRDFIAIDSRLTGNERLMVLFHELAHFLFHTPETGESANFHRIGRKTRQEKEADAFALCALMPTNSLATLEQSDQLSSEIIRERLKLFEQLRI